jgi:ATP-dependent DNA helicase RecG
MPSPIEKLQKFLKLETERGYDNRAVVGGLDKILPSWINEARSTNVAEEIIRSVSDTLNNYQNMAIENRPGALNKLMQQLQSTGDTDTTSMQMENRRRGKRKRQDRTQPKERVAAQPAPEARRVEKRSERPKSSAEFPPDIGLNAPLTVISGIGAKNAQNLKNLGLEFLGDLLFFFPRRYDDYSQLKPINRLEFGDELTIIAGVQSITTRSIRGGRMKITEAVVSDGSDFLRVNWFNQPWVGTRLKSGEQIVLSGKVDMYLGRLVMNSPEWEPLEKEHLHTNRIVPVYPLTANVTQRWLRKIMFDVISYWAPRMQDFLPQRVLRSAGLIDLPNALLQVHFPDTEGDLSAARERLAFDEIFLMQLGVMRQRHSWLQQTCELTEVPTEWLQQRIESLPYTLTGAQNRVLDDIRADLRSGRPMNRLLQGDVGSGKTIVAALTAEMLGQCGAQSALMAPTSILAEQHFRSISALMNDQEDSRTGLRPQEIRLLVGDTPEAEKETIREELASGQVKLVIGTHALLEDPVQFKDLRLVIIDEQHRFGVGQRSILRAKGNNPHLLVMTATPIPRSLALTLYGDLDLSILDEMPAGRIPVKTYVLPPVQRERAYNLIRAQNAAGRQAFIIYPYVEQGDRDEIKAAVDEHERLQREVFHKLNLGLLHGRMKPEEKEQVMIDFRDRKLDVLVSTSVVEVGVDIPNATVMLIEGANRFGLAQLHQFRGRVGRGGEQSYCLMIPESADKVENERLAVMVETNDGFVLADRDLSQRGPGEFLGTRQSGFNQLKMASLSDVPLIQKAREEAKELFQEDPELNAPIHTNLVDQLNRFWGDGRGDVS